MNCIMTTLTILSIFTGSQWNNIEVSTNSKFVVGINEQVSSKAEMISKDIIKTETVTVKCGEDIYSVTNSFLTVEK